MKFPSATVLDIPTAGPAAPGDRTNHTAPRRHLVTLGDYFRLCRERWRSLAVIVAAGCLAGFVITQFQTPVFRARAALELQNLNPDFLNLRQAKSISDASGGPTDLLIDLETEIEVLRSAAVREKTVEPLGQAGHGQKWQPAPAHWMIPIGNLRPAPLPQDILSSVASSLYVRRVGQTRLIRLEVDAPDPGLAADFANALVREYMRQNIAAHEQANHDAEDLTRNQLATMREKIAGSEKSLQDFANDHHLIYGSDQRDISDERIKQIQSDLLDARTDLAAKDAARQVVLKSDPGAIPEFVKDAHLRDLQAELIDLRRHEAELSTVYQPEYGELRKVRSQATELERSIQQETGRVVDEIEIEYQQAKAKEKTLASAYDAAVQDTEKTSEYAAQYNLMKQDVDVSLTAYERMLSRAKDLTLASALKMTDIQVIDPATPPESPRFPNLTLNLVMAFFGSFILGVAWNGLRQRCEEKDIRAPGDLARMLGVDELGAVSSALPGSAVRRRLQSIRGRLGGANNIPGNGSYAIGGPVADDFAGIATSLRSASSSGGHSRVIVFTSTAPREGKTTITANLASTLARAGRSVLLIDGDVRHPALHTFFGLKNDRGLVNLLEEGASGAQTRVALQQTSVPGLELLSSGSSENPPAGLLFQLHLRRLLLELRHRFDLILIDSPPMAHCPDARYLANAADGVILIARSKRTTRDSIQGACERLRLDRSRLLGVVLNDYRAEGAPYKYYA